MPKPVPIPVRLYNRPYTVGLKWSGRAIWVGFDSERGEWTFQDEEGREAEVGPQCWHPPPVGAQGALRNLGTARREDAGRLAVGGGCAHFSLSVWLCPDQTAAALAGDSSVILIAPEGGVVWGVRDRDLLADVVVMAHALGELEFFGIDVEAIDVVEDAFGVVDDAAGGGAVPVPRCQRCHAPPQARGAR